MSQKRINRHNVGREKELMQLMVDIKLKIK